MECRLGSTVGYAIRFEDCTSKETVIKYMTTVYCWEIAKWTRPRSLFLCNHGRGSRESFKYWRPHGLDQESPGTPARSQTNCDAATMNSKRFSDFFGGAPEFFIPGRTFPVDIMFHRSPVEDYVDQAVQQVLAIHVSMGPGIYLVFYDWPGGYRSDFASWFKNVLMLSMIRRSSVFFQLQSDACRFTSKDLRQKLPLGVRKVIVATNIAETSLTVDGIMYVVDAGYSKLKVLQIQEWGWIPCKSHLSLKQTLRRELVAQAGPDQGKHSTCLLRQPSRRDVHSDYSRNSANQLSYTVLLSSHWVLRIFWILISWTHHRKIRLRPLCSIYGL